MVFMSIDSTETNSISIDEEQSLLDLYLAEPYTLHNAASWG
jgi:hypothetical protein